MFSLEYTSTIDDLPIIWMLISHSYVGSPEVDIYPLHISSEKANLPMPSILQQLDHLGVGPTRLRIRGFTP